MGLPVGLAFRTKGQLAIDILAEAFADGVRLGFVCGDEVYHLLLIRRHLTTGELAFHYCYLCYLPEGQPASPSRPVRAAGLRGRLRRHRPP
jgi:hypothetical protein